MPSRVELSVGGNVHGGFISGEVNLSMEQAANAFSIRYADRWTPKGDAWPIEAGDACKILIDGETVLSGYVDESTVRYNDKTQELEITGRSKTADLIDCSAHHKPGQWKNQKIDKICADLCSPFGISLNIKSGLLGDKFERFSVDTGETVIEAIGRAARLRGLFPLCNHAGELELKQAGTERTSTLLQSGINGNILSAQRTEGWQERYSDYFFRGQRAGNNDAFAGPAAHLTGDVQDELMIDRGRYRPLVVVSGGQDGFKDLKTRAIWEKNRRMGRSERINVLVSDYKNAEGIWKPNVLVSVLDSRLRVGDVDKNKPAELIIVSVRFRFGPEGSDGGYITELELTHPQAFTLEPVPKRKRKAPLKTLPSPNQ
jgi:prophage tail gpP-like protein